MCTLISVVKCTNETYQGQRSISCREADFLNRAKVKGES